MVDARTKLDIIYQEGLSDIHEVLDRVDVLKAELPAAADLLADKLNIQTGNYLAAAEKLAGVLQSMAAEIDRAAADAAENTKLDIRQAAAQAVSVGFAQSVGDEIQKVVAKIDQAAAGLVKETMTARTEIRQAAKSVSWSFGRVLGLVIGGGILSGMTTLLGAHYLPKTDPVELLSPVDRTFLDNGKAFNSKIWPNLTPSEKERIRQLTSKPAQ